MYFILLLMELFSSNVTFTLNFPLYSLNIVKFLVSILWCIKFSCSTVSVSRWILALWLQPHDTCILNQTPLRHYLRSFQSSVSKADGHQITIWGSSQPISQVQHLTGSSQVLDVLHSPLSSMLSLRYLILWDPLKHPYICIQVALYPLDKDLIREKQYLPYDFVCLEKTYVTSLKTVFQNWAIVIHDTSRDQLCLFPCLTSDSLGLYS